MDEWRFHDIDDLRSLIKLYHRWALKLHPDRIKGTVQQKYEYGLTFSRMTTAYETSKERLQNREADPVERVPYGNLEARLSTNRVFDTKQ
jgi:hypothetical protein